MGGGVEVEGCGCFNQGREGVQSGNGGWGCSTGQHRTDIETKTLIFPFSLRWSNQPDWVAVCNDLFFV